MALFSFLVYKGNAQETTFGLKGGLNYSSVVGDLTEGIKFRFSGHGGLFLEITFSEKFQLRPELLYSSQGFQFSTDLAAIQNGGSTGEENDFRTNVQLNYLTVPLLGKFALNDRYAVEFGPQFGFLLNQVTKIKNLDELDGIDVNQRSSVSGDFQLDYGVAVGLDMRLNNHFSLAPRFYIGIRNRLNGLPNVQNFNAASINIVANGFSSLIKKDDEILVSAMEHHSNIVPWQMLCERTGAVLKVIPMNQEGELLMNVYDDLLSDKTKLVFCNHISNALGTINPIEEIISKAHKVGAAVLIDGAQAAPHLIADVQKLDVDFYTVSAHKICGPGDS